VAKIRWIIKRVGGRVKRIPILDKGKVQKPLSSLGSRVDEVARIRKSARTQPMSRQAAKISMNRASALGKKVDTVMKDILRRNRPKKVKKSKELRRALTKKKQMEALDRKIEKEFGFTNIPEDAGFLDRKGRMIDLSGRNQGNIYGGRVRDHREVERVFESPKVKADAMGTRSQNLFEYMSEANSIRISDHGTVFNVDFAKEPTRAQVTMLKAITKRKLIYADLTSTKGDVIRSGEFNNIQEALNALFGPKKK